MIASNRPPRFSLWERVRVLSGARPRSIQGHFEKSGAGTIGTIVLAEQSGDDVTYGVEFTRDATFLADASTPFGMFEEDYLESLGEMGWQYHRSIEFPAEFMRFERVRLHSQTSSSIAIFGHQIGKTGFVFSLRQAYDGKWTYTVTLDDLVYDDSLESAAPISLDVEGSWIESLGSVDDDAEEWWTNPPTVRVVVDESGEGKILPAGQ